MRHLRDFVFELACNDPQMHDMGFTRDSLYPVYSRDSTPESIEGKRFGIFRWGSTEVGIGRVNPVTLEVWLYDRDPRYDVIGDGLLRMRTLLENAVGSALDLDKTAWMNGWQFSGSTPDLFDDVYIAYTRSESHRITASGS